VRFKVFGESFGGAAADQFAVGHRQNLTGRPDRRCVCGRRCISATPARSGCRISARANPARFPSIVGPKKDDICYATQNRQDAVKAMVAKVDMVIVVGSPNSSNSNRLREVAANRGVPAYMIDHADELRPEWVIGKLRVGVTAGASLESPLESAATPAATTTGGTP